MAKCLCVASDQTYKHNSCCLFSPNCLRYLGLLPPLQSLSACDTKSSFHLTVSHSILCVSYVSCALFYLHVFILRRRVWMASCRFTFALAASTRWVESAPVPAHRSTDRGVTCSCIWAATPASKTCSGRTACGMARRPMPTPSFTTCCSPSVLPGAGQTYCAMRSSQAG